MATINVLDSVGSTVALEKPLAPARAAAASSRPVVLSNEDKTALDLLHTDLVAATPAGANIIGKVGIDQTTPGTTNQVSAVQNGAWTMRNVGSTAAILDFSGQAAASPAAAFHVGGQFNTTPTTLTNGTSSPLQLDNAGNLKINVVTGGAGGGVVTQATASNLNATVKITDGTTALPILAASSGAPAATVPAIPVSIRDVNPNGRAAAASSGPVVLSTEDNALIARLLPSATASGATPSRINAAASTNATSLKASAGQVYTIDVFNPAAYNVFLKLYNKASAPTVGTDTPVMTIPIQAGGGFSKTWPTGFPFSTGIAYAITKLQADSDTTVVVAGDLTGNTTWI